MGSLRTKVFVIFVSLLLLVQAVSLLVIYQANKKQEQQQIDLRLESAISAFQSQYEQRRYYLQAFSETAAKDFGLKEVFDADLRSFLIALNNHRKRINADLALAVNRENLITGQLLRRADDEKVKVGPEQGNFFSAPEWFEGEKALSQIYTLGNKVYQLSFSPLKSGQDVVGWIGYGYEINSLLAQNFADSTGLSIEFILKTGNNAWVTLASGHPSMIGLDEQPSELQGVKLLDDHTQDSYIHTHTVIEQSDNRELMAVIYGSRSDLLEALRKNLWELLVLEGATILVSLLAAYVLAGDISRPVKKLVTQAQFIAKGNYDTAVTISEKNELGQLASEFNQMQQAVLDREQKISHQLYYNTLTNLPNRNSLVDQLETLFTAPEQHFTLLHLDIRRTKTVNDTLGYDAGDLMIQEVGERLVNLNEEPLTFHLGADEFAVLLKSSDQTEINNWKHKIEAAMDTPLCGEETLLHLQLHIGFARAPEDGSDAHQLLQKADTALSHGKREMKSFLAYQPDMDADANRRLSLVNDLKVALERNDQLKLFYQPKMDIASGEISHLEALIRWQHPEQGMIPPDAFINIAEQTGQIDTLTNWVIREAARQYQEWNAIGLQLSIAVNISAENLKNQYFTEELKNIWLEFTLPKDALSLEITESAVVADPDCAIQMLCEIRNQGIKLSIDDYGTGYSSLAQLKQLPVTELKIDRSFVDKVNTDPDDQIIVRSTIRMAHDMGLTVVAEGIEDQNTLNWLRDNSCDLAQGYFISRPLPHDELTSWLTARLESLAESDV
ncbi:MAG: EAL domain-containing protein [Neptuniibacter sp.]